MDRYSKGALILILQDIKDKVIVTGSYATGNKPVVAILTSIFVVNRKPKLIWKQNASKTHTRKI